MVRFLKILFHLSKLEKVDLNFKSSIRSTYEQIILRLESSRYKSLGK